MDLIEQAKALAESKPHPDMEHLERIQHWLQHASVYALSGKPVPGWVWNKLRGVLKELPGAVD